MLFLKGWLIKEDSIRVHGILSIINLAMSYSIAALCISSGFSINYVMTLNSAFTSSLMCFVFPYSFYLATRTAEETRLMSLRIMLVKGFVVFFLAYWLYSIADVLFLSYN